MSILTTYFYHLLPAFFLPLFCLPDDISHVCECCLVTGQVDVIGDILTRRAHRSSLRREHPKRTSTALPSEITQLGRNPLPPHGFSCHYPALCSLETPCGLHDPSLLFPASSVLWAICAFFLFYFIVCFLCIFKFSTISLTRKGGKQH